eukprot:scaffold158_cov388-Prasinococcus_capsulatus_cf.AAC.2
MLNFRERASWRTIRKVHALWWGWLGRQCLEDLKKGTLPGHWAVLRALFLQQPNRALEGSQGERISLHESGFLHLQLRVAFLDTTPAATAKGAGRHSPTLHPGRGRACSKFVRTSSRWHATRSGRLWQA